MSHANAALTPRARLRLARLVVDQGWPMREQRNATTCRGRREAVGRRYRQLGEDGMVDASSRPHHSPNRTPAPVVRKIVHLRWKQRLGPVQIADRVGLAPSTVHAVLVRCRLNRLTHVDRATGEPIRRYEHDKPGAMFHVDVKKLGNVPDGGGWRFVGRQQGDRNRQRTRDRTGLTQHLPQPKVGTAFVHTVIDDHSRVAYAEIHDDEKAATATAVLRRAVAWFAARGVRRRAGAVRQRHAPTARTCGATPAPSWASPTKRTRPTDRRQTARSNGSTAPWPTAGRSRSSTTPNQPAAQLCQHGSTSTTTTGPTPQSAGKRPSAA